ncbi:hypothetical protein NUU61_007976 [Penicillium alfredii]|uniref:Uncharacterized protein n=1 Tax=Penicillium alfredii TaxID=1506179 RepID=A0A9W9JYI0_9EURO|nr:uncharacterized protein NUU61_007976 [Penicillium alfredii]KAJ5086669.1 hypothetical protein NUU61_007976 [Penicillium alfredii]
MTSSVDSIRGDIDEAGPGSRTPTGNALPLRPPLIPDISTVAEFKNGAEPDGSQTGKGAERPLAAWKSKRAQEDYHRAMENVIDKDFSLGEFGDPFDERDLEEKLL